MSLVVRRLTGDDAAYLLAQTGDSAIFGAIDGSLVGMLGLHRDPRRKVAHKVLLWGMYVSPGARGGGVGRRLVEAALDHARLLDGVTCARISVTDTALEAKALYERIGFEVWGTEPDAVRYEGQTVRETHMGLSLA